MKWAVRSGNGFTWHKTKKAAMLYAAISAEAYGWAEVLRIPRLSLPLEVIPKSSLVARLTPSTLRATIASVNQPVGNWTHRRPIRE
jgi:hypothetical protein